MKINDFIKTGGVIEDLYLDSINTVTRIPINPLNQRLSEYDQINPDIKSAVIDPHTKHLELVMVVDPKRPTTYFNTFTDAEQYIKQL